MHRCLKSIQDDMIRTVTGMTSFDSDPKDMASLVQEFKDSASFWFEANCLATPSVSTGHLWDGWFSSPQIQTDSGDLAESQPRLKKFLKVEHLGFSESIHVRRAISASVKAAQRLDDADEGIFAIGAFLRLEEGQAVPEIDRTLIDRKRGPADWDERFFATYKSQPRDGDWSDERSWFEDCFDEEPMSAFVWHEWKRTAWWGKCEAVFSDPEQLRLKICCPGLDDTTLRNATLALKPVFSAPGRGEGDGLEHAAWTMVDFLATRSRRGKLEKPEVARGFNSSQREAHTAA
jgi:hypothetical protein